MDEALVMQSSSMNFFPVTKQNLARTSQRGSLPGALCARPGTIMRLSFTIRAANALIFSAGDAVPAFSFAVIRFSPAWFR